MHHRKQWADDLDNITTLLGEANYLWNKLKIHTSIVLPPQSGKSELAIRTIEIQKENFSPSEMAYMTYNKDLARDKAEYLGIQCLGPNEMPETSTKFLVMDDPLFHNSYSEATTEQKEFLDYYRFGLWALLDSMPRILLLESRCFGKEVSAQLRFEVNWRHAVVDARELFTDSFLKRQQQNMGDKYFNNYYPNSRF